MMRRNDEDSMSTCWARQTSRLLFDTADKAGSHVRHDDSNLAGATWMRSTNDCWRVVLCKVPYRIVEPGRTGKTTPLPRLTQNIP